MDNKVSTPFFLIREQILNDNISGFKKALKELWPNSTLAYSEKTNSLPWILRWMKQHGVLAEVVSDEEYKVALMCGYSDEQIVFNGPIKGADALDRALDGGAFVNLDSERDIRFCAAYGSKIHASLGIRLNVDPGIFSIEDVGFQEDGFRFGFSEESGAFSRALSILAPVYDVKRIGLHLHVNSVTRAVNVYRNIARYAAELIDKYRLEPAFIDIGGGFFGGVPGKPEPSAYLLAIKSELEKHVDISHTKLILEPGSAAIGSKRYSPCPDRYNGRQPDPY